MMFNEWIKDNSLFTEIDSIKPFTFISQHGAKNIDLVYKMSYGSKPIPKNVECLTVNEVANIIVVNYGDSWNNKYNLLKDEILLGVEEKTVLDETVTDEYLRTMSSNQENKVSAFNDDEMSPNDSSNDSLNDKSDKDVNRNREITKTSLNAIKTQLEIFNSNFINIVCKDVSKIVSLSIY